MVGRSYSSSSSSSPFSSGYSGAKTTSSKNTSKSTVGGGGGGGNSAKENYRTGSAYQSTAKKASTISKKNTIKQDMIDFANYSYQKPTGLGKFSPLVQFMDITGIGKKTHEINKQYYIDNVIGKTNPVTGKAYSANITEYQNYLKSRNAGTIDAMGRSIVQGGDGGNQQQVQIPTQTPTQTLIEQEEEMKKKKRSALGIGYGGSQRTILTASIGDETEANVSKTILGGGIKA
jgi:hypothetical protein